MVTNNSQNKKVNNVHDTEYSVIRAQILQYDQTCVSILGVLLTASTAVYGIAIEKQSFVLLPILSIIWIVGFLYISEKRFWIRRSALYLRTEVESKTSGLYWQNWLKDNDNDKRFLRFSPLKYEYCLLFIVNITNLILTYINYDKSKNIFYIFISIATLLLTIFLYFKVLRFYYNKSVKA